MNIEFFPFNFWFDKQARYYVSNKLNSPVNDRSSHLDEGEGQRLENIQSKVNTEAEAGC